MDHINIWSSGEPLTDRQVRDICCVMPVSTLVNVRAFPPYHLQMESLLPERRPCSDHCWCFHCHLAHTLAHTFGALSHPRCSRPPPGRLPWLIDLSRLGPCYMLLQNLYTIVLACPPRLPPLKVESLISERLPCADHCWFVNPPQYQSVRTVRPCDVPVRLTFLSCAAVTGQQLGVPKERTATPHAVLGASTRHSTGTVRTVRRSPGGTKHPHCSQAAMLLRTLHKYVALCCCHARCRCGTATCSLWNGGTA